MMKSWVTPMPRSVAPPRAVGSAVMQDSWARIKALLGN